MYSTLDEGGKCTALWMKGQVYNRCFHFNTPKFIVQEPCENRGGRPGLSVLTSLLVSVDIGLSLSLICQPTSEDIKQHYLLTLLSPPAPSVHGASPHRRRSPQGEVKEHW